MTRIHWDQIFSQIIDRRPGVSDSSIDEFVATIGQPLSSTEIEWLKPRDPDVDTWIIPDAQLPDSYLDFLRWSNGGEFRNGDRLLQFFPIDDQKDGVRATMLAYRIPRLSPGILPFAFNGGGIFYAFDMRFRSTDGEYAIVAAECGHAHMPFTIDPTFLDACRSTVDFELAWDEEDEITRPLCNDCGEFLVCPECGKRGPVTH